MLRSSLFVLAASLTTNAQTLYEALSQHPSLSNFTAFYQNNDAFANAFFANESNYPITFLAPNDDAFAAYQEQTGTPLTDAPVDKLSELIQYHTLVASLGKDNFSESGAAGFTTPTLLTGDEHNNRTVGPAMASKYGGPGRAAGQVVFIKNADSGSEKKRFVLSNRQDGGAQNTIRSGLSSNVLLTALDDDQGVWDGGRFHIVDGLLTPPEMCSDTIRAAKLTGLDNALNRSGLWSALDSSKNVTCLGPSNKAFEDAGSPDANLDKTALSGALHFHTLPEVAYSDYLEDGQEFQSLQNSTTVRVKIEGEGKDRTIWFNNAKVIDANVLTHNGLMHVLDAVMVPLEQMNATPTSTPSPTASPTSPGESPASSTGVAATIAAGTVGCNWSLWIMLGATVLFTEGLGGRW